MALIYYRILSSRIRGQGRMQSDMGVMAGLWDLQDTSLRNSLFITEIKGFHYQKMKMFHTVWVIVIKATDNVYAI